MSGATLHVEKNNQVLLSWHGGTAQDSDCVFLVASITKPLVCLAAARMLEREQLHLEDTVASYFPAFGKHDKCGVNIKHLLTHSSGLPDFIPEHNSMRRNKSSLCDYFKATCSAPLKFIPGTDTSYQSMGILALSMVMQKILGKSIRKIIEEEIVNPFELNSTSLGWRKEFAGKFCPPIPAKDSEGSWVWNTEYWRNLGAPWGGAFSTAPDIAKILGTLLNQGLYKDRQILQPNTVRTVLTNHTVSMPEMQKSAVKNYGWGLGWAIATSSREPYGGTSNFGPKMPNGAFGHSGVTGTVCWADPKSNLCMVLLTNGKMPGARKAIRECCDIVATMT